MEIYLLRHGIAEDAPPGMPDAGRALTPEGKKKLREVLKVARSAEVRVSLILTSPLRRAVQTAEIAAEVLGYRGNLVKSQALAPMVQPPEVWDEIRTHRGTGQLLMAGHEPQFSSLAAYLLGVPELMVDFKKGALVRIDMDQLGAKPRGVLKWMLVAKLAAGC